MHPDAISHTDVLILGGGPAGAALALMLLQRRPGLRVWIVEKSGYRERRIGETVPPEIADLMIPLGVWESFLREGHAPAPGTAAVWGSGRLVENDFMFRVGGRGWHLDKNRFDEFLVREAEKRGARVLANTRATFLEKKEGSFQFNLEPPTGAPQRLNAVFVVDATGRSAAFATRMGAGKVRFDNLCALYRFYECTGSPPAMTTLVETWENGWWYSALLPSGQIAVACLTDSDRVDKISLQDAGWEQQLKSAPHTRRRLEHARPDAAVRIWPAASQCLDQLCGSGWIAVGDAAGSFDPLSAQGIFKGIKSGIIGAYAVLDYLDGNSDALARYEKLLRQEYETYLELRGHFYRQEQRWPESLFWQRRFAGLTLDPSIKLVAAKNRDEEGHPTRYFLSRQEEAAIRKLCARPRPAGEIVAAFREPPFEYKKDRNIILGLQFLLEKRVLELSGTVDVL